MDIYLHVKVLLGMILGLAVGHLLRGVALIVQHPKKNRAYWVHGMWTLFLFIYLLHFWWWEFSLSKVNHWTFPVYFFIAVYATLVYLLCTVLVPDDLQGYGGFQDYFYSRKAWFFALLAVLFVADTVDTMIKGRAYLHSLGWAYDIRTAAYFVLSLVAIKIRNTRFHAAFATFAVVYEVLYIWKLYLTIG